jgi:hypothetical protein
MLSTRRLTASASKPSAGKPRTRQASRQSRQVRKEALWPQGNASLLADSIGLHAVGRAWRAPAFTFSLSRAPSLQSNLSR